MFNVAVLNVVAPKLSSEKLHLHFLQRAATRVRVRLILQEAVSIPVKGNALSLHCRFLKLFGLNERKN
jgi:hypothetical protein